MAELLDYVDENNIIIGTAPAKEIYARRLNHRIVHLLLFNKKGELLLQRRSKTKPFLPLAWVTSAGGRVDAGETYETAVARETKEELGIDVKLEHAFDDAYADPRGMTMFLSTFRATHEGPFAIDPIEVDSVAFFSFDEIRAMVARGEPIHPELLFLLKKHFGFPDSSFP